MLDKDGLITRTRDSLSNQYATYARSESELEGLNLMDTIKTVKPNILIGLSGQGGIFTEEVLS